MKKIKKFLSFNNLIASRPIIDAKDGFSPSSNLTGGVLGKAKENTPSTNEATPDIKNVFFKAPSEAAASHLKI
ncbi:hypothetical protein D3C72_1756440 [compost metagenome]